MASGKERADYSAVKAYVSCVEKKDIHVNAFLNKYIFYLFYITNEIIDKEIVIHLAPLF